MIDSLLVLDPNIVAPSCIIHRTRMLLIQASIGVANYPVGKLPITYFSPSTANCQGLRRFIWKQEFGETKAAEYLRTGRPEDFPFQKLKDLPTLQWNLLSSVSQRQVPAPDANTDLYIELETLSVTVFVAMQASFRFPMPCLQARHDKCFSGLRRRLRSRIRISTTKRVLC